MVYYLTDMTPPTDWDSFWDQASEGLDFFEAAFENMEFETREQAIAGRYRKATSAADMRLDSSHLFRFRETDDRDNLLYFYELGRSILRTTRDAVFERQMTPAFAHQWAILMFCHGFVMSSAFALGDDMQSKRAGQAGGRSQSRERQDRWFAHYFLQAFRNRPDRRAAEDAVEKLIKGVLAGGVKIGDEFKPDWFEVMLGKDGLLSSRYRQKAMSVPQMERLVKLPSHDLPPLNLSDPTP